MARTPRAAASEETAAPALEPEDQQAVASEEPAVPEPDEEQPKASTTREYVVFESREHGEAGRAWVEIGRTQAGTYEDAVRRVTAVEGGDHREGTFSATPARSWHPLTVRIETRTVSRFSASPV
jgi:hypothetical protein